MRIISGKFRGRQLVSFKADHIRPTTDRVKESIFNKLQAEISGARVLDLFSGTGNLAIEALSRDAAHVTAVEMSKKSIAIIRQNLEKLAIPKSEIAVVLDDALKYLRKYQGDPFDLILADPPFTEKLADSVLRELTKSQAVGPQTLIMIEASTHETLHQEYENLICYDQRDYGDKKVSYFQRKVADADSGLSG